MSIYGLLIGPKTVHRCGKNGPQICETGYQGRSDAGSCNLPARNINIPRWLNSRPNPFFLCPRVVPEALQSHEHARKAQIPPILLPAGHPSQRPRSHLPSMLFPCRKSSHRLSALQRHIQLDPIQLLPPRRLRLHRKRLLRRQQRPVLPRSLHRFHLHLAIMSTDV